MTDGGNDHVPVLRIDDAGGVGFGDGEVPPVDDCGGRDGSGSESSSSSSSSSSPSSSPQQSGGNRDRDCDGALTRNEAEDLRRLLKERDDRIASLESARIKQEEEIAFLRSEAGASQTKHRDAVYWIKLEVDTLRQEKAAAEDRMGELYRDMREIEFMGEDSEVMMMVGGEDVRGGVPTNMNGKYVLNLQSQLSKSMQTMRVLDNQIGMMKRSYNAVVESLKEEIFDVMDDKSSIEMELLNQLAILDSEKRNQEDEYHREKNLRDERIKGRDDVIRQLREKAQRLERLVIEAKDSARTESGQESQEKKERVQNAVAAAMISCSAFNASPPTGKPNNRDRGGEDEDAEAELRLRMEELERDNALLEDRLGEERAAASEASARLQGNMQSQDERIKQLTEEIDSVRLRGAEDVRAASDMVQRDQSEAIKMLERVAEIWEKNDESIQMLEGVADKIRGGTENGGRRGGCEGDQGRALSTQEAASHVCGQIKVSLLLVEARLRNQLTALCHDVKPSTALERPQSAIGGGVGAPSAAGGDPRRLGGTSIDKLLTHVDDAQREMLDALEHVEQSMTAQIRLLELRQEDGEESLRVELAEKIDALLGAQERHKRLRDEHDALERRFSELHAENEELDRQNRELRGSAADDERGVTELRRDRERLERENAELLQDKKNLERARKNLDTTKQELGVIRGELDSLENIKSNLEWEGTDLQNRVDKNWAETRAGRKKARDARDVQKESGKVAARVRAERDALNEQQKQQQNGPTTEINPMQLQIFEKLQKEIVAVVGRVKAKNKTIENLNRSIEEYKVREMVLKKELKNIIRRVKAIEESGSRSSGNGSRRHKLEVR